MAKPSTRPFRRLEVIVDGGQPSAASTASVTLVTVNNLDSGGNIYAGTIANLNDLFNRLGFEGTFSYSPPEVV